MCCKYTTWDPGFTSLQMEVVLQIVTTPKNPSTLAGFEPANSNKILQEQSHPALLLLEVGWLRSLTEDSGALRCPSPSGTEEAV
jgi:hypothetical protein